MKWYQSKIGWATAIFLVIVLFTFGSPLMGNPFANLFGNPLNMQEGGVNIYLIVAAYFLGYGIEKWSRKKKPLQSSLKR